MNKEYISYEQVQRGACQNLDLSKPNLMNLLRKLKTLLKLIMFQAILLKKLKIDLKLWQVTLHNIKNETNALKTLVF